MDARRTLATVLLAALLATLSGPPPAAAQAVAGSTSSSFGPAAPARLTAPPATTGAAAPGGAATGRHGPPIPAPAAAGTVGVDGGWPLSPRPEVVGRFDPPAQRWQAGHRGVDLRGRVGQPVHAARDGTVSFAGRVAGKGVVVVDHGATRTTYEPVSAIVKVGDVVRAGERLGTLELLGSHCLPAACLHWGLLEGERYLDPLTLVGAGPVRLLPWAATVSGFRPAGGPGGTPGAAGPW